MFSVSVDGKALNKYEIVEESVGQAMADLLRSLKQDAEDYLNTAISRAQLAIPDNFQPEQNEALETAARNAGFEQVQLVDCSHCVLLAYSALEHDHTALLLDLGSSNLEVSLCRVADGDVQRIDYAQENLGGRDWNFILSHELSQQNQNLAPDKIELIKQDLTFRKKVKVGLVTLTRARFEELSAPLLERCRMRIEQVIAGRKVDCVYLSGGASRMPMIADLMHRVTGTFPEQGPVPDEVVALGSVLAKPSDPLPPAPASRGESTSIIVEAAQMTQIMEQIKLEDLKQEPEETPAESSSVSAAAATVPPPSPPGFTGGGYAPPPPPPGYTGGGYEAPPPPPGYTGGGYEAPLPPPGYQDGHDAVSVNSNPFKTWPKRRENLKKILPNCWQKESPDGQRVMWRLKEDFVKHYFPGSPYEQIIQDGDPEAAQPSCVVFQRSDGGYDIFLRSGQAHQDYYDFHWCAGEPSAQVRRWREGLIVSEATLESAPGAPFLILQSPDIQEMIQFDPRSLLRMDAESQRDRIMQMMPWLKLLTWFGRLQQLDPSGFKKVPIEIRMLLKGDQFEHTIGSLPPQRLQKWIQNGALPPALDYVNEGQAQGLLHTIATLQAIGRQQGQASKGMLASFMSSMSGQPKVPGILLPLNLEQLDILDLQVLVTIGALESVETKYDKELRALIARRPDLQAKMRSPDGQSALTNDPEILALKNRPDIQRELSDRAWKSMGNTGPSPMEQVQSMQRGMAWSYVFGYPLDPALFFSTKQAPWKIYKPYPV
jgi:Ethanolamine utilization protein EutJ (predicted chaperonin)